VLRTSNGKAALDHIDALEEHVDADCVILVDEGT